MTPLAPTNRPGEKPRVLSIVTSPLKKILVVDDDPAILAIAQLVLGRAGYEVETRDSALGTTKCLMQGKHDLVLLDVNMPGLDGTELTALVRKQLPHVTVVLHSAMDAQALSDLALKHGAHAAIPKGSSGVVLRSTIANLLEKQQ